MVQGVSGANTALIEDCTTVSSIATLINPLRMRVMAETRGISIPLGVQFMMCICLYYIVACVDVHT